LSSHYSTYAHITANIFANVFFSFLAVKLNTGDDSALVKDLLDHVSRLLSNVENMALETKERSNVIGMLNNIQGDLKETKERLQKMELEQDTLKRKLDDTQRELDDTKRGLDILIKERVNDAEKCQNHPPGMYEYLFC
jgi:predicted nuclease with TOPRIM domain